MYLFYGCRRADEDFLYREEWPRYEQELKGVFRMKVAFSREMKKPDGSRFDHTLLDIGCITHTINIGKVYVQDLIHDLASELAPLILEKRAYIYICGDAKNMSKAVEERLMEMLGAGKGGSAAVEGAKELKMLKERNVSGLSSWLCKVVTDGTVLCRG